MITFVLWKWRQTGRYAVEYTAAHTNAMASMLRRNYRKPCRIICVTDNPKDVQCETFPLWNDLSHIQNVSGQHLPSCYRRLKIFDPVTQRAMGILEGRIASVDTDGVITRDPTPLFEREERFVGWHVPGTRHQTVYNGSMFMFTAGDLEFVWKDFDPKNSPRKGLFAGYMGSDQGWLSYKLMNQPYAGGWREERDGVLSFMRNIECRGKARRKLDPMTQGRIVFFAGRRKPWHYDVLQQCPWIHGCVKEPQELAA